MGKRVLTALVLCGVLLLALRANNPWVFGSLLGVMVLAGAWEWSALCGAQRWQTRVGYVLLVVAAIACCRIYLWEPQRFAGLMIYTTLWWLLALLWVMQAPQRVTTWSAAVAGLLALAPPWVALLRIASEWHDGMRWTLFVLGIAVAMDTGGYFAGHAFGRLKLAPRVSPGKTWEGVIGGMVLVLVLAVVGRSWLSENRNTFVALCLAAAAFSVVGDLTESLLKRASGLKDSGRLFPGHGGVLDRVDSMTAAVPVMTLGLIWLGVGV
jgi:phosphatidate cytidylyltransferase